MLRIGITGGIGSGKSTVCRIFEQLGVPVFYADQETREMYNNHPELRQKLIKEFGADMYNESELNRPALAAAVFKNPEALSRLNGIVHPYVFERFEAWCRKHSDVPYTLKEAAILFESGSYKRLHYIIGVTAPQEMRIQRVMERDHTTRAAVEDRMKNQMDQNELVSRCQFIIENDGEKSLIAQVTELHQQLLKLSAENPDPPLQGS